MDDLLNNRLDPGKACDELYGVFWQFRSRYSKVQQLLGIWRANAKVGSAVSFETIKAHIGI